MRLEGDPRKPDQARQPVGGPRDPAMPAIALGKDSSDGEGCDGMTGRETAGAQVERPLGTTCSKSRRREGYLQEIAVGLRLWSPEPGFPQRAQLQPLVGRSAANRNRGVPSPPRKLWWEQRPLWLRYC